MGVLVLLSRTRYRFTLIAIISFTFSACSLVDPYPRDHYRLQASFIVGEEDVSCNLSIDLLSIDDYAIPGYFDLGIHKLNEVGKPYREWVRQTIICAQWRQYDIPRFPAPENQFSTLLFSVNIYTKNAFSRDYLTVGENNFLFKPETALTLPLRTPILGPEPIPSEGQDIEGYAYFFVDLNGWDKRIKKLRSFLSPCGVGLESTGGSLTFNSREDVQRTGVFMTVDAEIQLKSASCF